MLFSFVLLFIACDCLVINDYEIQDHSLNPTLGRGLAYSTGVFYSNCLEVPVTTQPSYDVKYHMELSSSTDELENSLKGKFSGSLGYSFLSGRVSGEKKSKTVSKKVVQYMIATMTLNTYYGGIDYSKTKLLESAVTLLDKENIIGFFQSCGPHYIDHIQRKSEMVAFFKFESDTKLTEDEIKGAISASVGWGPWRVKVSASMEKTSRSFNEKTKTIIDIRAFGMGDGAEGVISARTIDDFSNALQHCYLAMKDVNVGTVVGLNLVGWMNNLEFHKELTESERYDSTNPLHELRVVSNGDFVARITTNLRHFMDLYSRGIMCISKLKILASTVEHKGGSTKNTLIKDHKSNNKYAATLQSVMEIITKENMDNLMLVVKTYIDKIYGQCLKQLGSIDEENRYQFFEKEWSEITQCQFALSITNSFEQEIMDIGIVENYCNPEIAEKNLETKNLRNVNVNTEGKMSNELKEAVTNFEKEEIEKIKAKETVKPAETPKEPETS